MCWTTCRVYLYSGPSAWNSLLANTYSKMLETNLLGKRLKLHCLSDHREFHLLAHLHVWCGVILLALLAHLGVSIGSTRGRDLPGSPVFPVLLDLLVVYFQWRSTSSGSHLERSEGQWPQPVEETRQSPNVPEGTGRTKSISLNPRSLNIVSIELVRPIQFNRVFFNSYSLFPLIPKKYGVSLPSLWLRQSISNLQRCG